MKYVQLRRSNIFLYRPSWFLLEISYLAFFVAPFLHCAYCVGLNGDYLEAKREYYQNCFIFCQRESSLMGTVNRNSSYSPVGPRVFYVFLGCMVFLYVGVCFVLPWTVESFPFVFWRWRVKLK